MFVPSVHVEAGDLDAEIIPDLVCVCEVVWSSIGN
jgi:hypothetical protein